MGLELEASQARLAELEEQRKIVDQEHAAEKDDFTGRLQFLEKENLDLMLQVKRMKKKLRKGASDTVGKENSLNRAVKHTEAERLEKLKASAKVGGGEATAQDSAATIDDQEVAECSQQ